MSRRSVEVVRSGERILSYKCIPYTLICKALEAMSIAIVTTAGVHLERQQPFYDNKADPDTSFRMIPGDVASEQLIVTHFAPAYEYDTQIPSQDINTVFPLDRLQELANEQFIGRVAATHYSFMGYMMRFHKLLEETMPSFIARLSQSNPDAVILTAGCPYSHRTVVILQRAIEAQGIPTVLITVDPDKSRNYRPPRAIHPVGLSPGCSAGFPHNVPQQREIVKSALFRLVTAQEPGTIHELHPADAKLQRLT